MKIPVANWLIAFFVFLFLSAISIQNSYALPHLDYPPPNIFIYSIPAPDFDDDSGLVKGEVVLINTGGNHVGALPISVWIEGLESQTKVSGWIEDMPGYGYLHSVHHQSLLKLLFESLNI